MVAIETSASDVANQGVRVTAHDSTARLSQCILGVKPANQLCARGKHSGRPIMIGFECVRQDARLRVTLVSMISSSLPSRTGSADVGFLGLR